MFAKLTDRFENIPTELKATLGFTISNILQKGILFLAVPIYTRILSPNQYGAYSVFLSWLEIFEIITTFRISWGGYVVGLNKYDDKDRYTSSLQCLSIFITSFFLIVYIVFYEHINQLVDMPTQMVLMMFVLMYCLPAMKFWTIRERVEYRYKAVLVVTVVSSLFIVVLGTFFCFFYRKKEIAVIFARVLVQGIVGSFLILHNCKNDFTIYDKTYWKRTLKFNIPLIPYYLSMVILNSSDRIIIKQLAGEMQAGIYSVAYTASMCMLLFSTSINGVLQPWLYEHMKKEKTENVPKVINISLIMISGLNLILIALAPEIIKILAPSQYHGAIWIIPPLAASVTVMFFYQHFVNIEFYFENSKLTSIASVGAALINIILNYIFIPQYGYLAAGYTTLASYLLFGFSHYYFMKMICKKNGYKETLINIKVMLMILAVFFMLASFFMIGYFKGIYRYLILIGLILSIIIMAEKIRIEAGGK